MTIFVALILSAFTSFVITSGIIILLKKKKFLVAHIKPELKDQQEYKEGTPSIGGLSIALGILIPTLLFNTLHNDSMQYALLAFFFFALLGFIDDLKKTKTWNGDGLSSLVKLVLQFTSATALIVFGEYHHLNTIGFPFIDSFPFLRGGLLIFMLVYFVNAFNISDGLDGLLITLMIPILVFFALALLIESNTRALKIFVTVLFFSVLAFLYFNKFPAQCFMGDSGSMGLGSLVFILALLLHVLPFFVIATLMFSVELFSSLLQIIAIRVFKKKIFSIAPIHHMFQKKGESEVAIVKRFALYSSMASIIAFLVYLSSL